MSSLSYADVSPAYVSTTLAQALNTVDNAMDEGWAHMENRVSNTINPHWHDFSEVLVLSFASPRKIA